MKLSATIMAHPARAEHVAELQNELDRDIPVVWASNPEPTAEPPVRWATGRAAWETHDPAADWHMVIQDDAVVSRDLLAGLETALDELGPEGLMSAYTGSPRPTQLQIARQLRSAETRHRAWASTGSLCWGVAIIAPVHTIGDMLDWCSAGRRRNLNYDLRIGRYYRDIVGWRTWFPVPSLVDHRDVPSLVGHEDGRHAHNMHTGSALDIDWTAHNGLDIDAPDEVRRKRTD